MWPFPVQIQREELIGTRSSQDLRLFYIKGILDIFVGKLWGLESWPWIERLQCFHIIQHVYSILITITQSQEQSIFSGSWSCCPYLMYPLNKVSVVIPPKVTISLSSWLYSPAVHWGLLQCILYISWLCYLSSPAVTAHLNLCQVLHAMQPAVNQVIALL